MNYLLLMILSVSALYGAEELLKMQVRVFPLQGAPTLYSVIVSQQCTLDNLLTLFSDKYPTFLEHKECMAMTFYPPQATLFMYTKMSPYDLRRKMFDDDGIEISDVICYLVEHKKPIARKK